MDSEKQVGVFTISVNYDEICEHVTLPQFNRKFVQVFLDISYIILLFFRRSYSWKLRSVHCPPSPYLFLRISNNLASVSEHIFFSTEVFTQLWKTNARIFFFFFIVLWFSAATMASIRICANNFFILLFIEFHNWIKKKIYMRYDIQ